MREGPLASAAGLSRRMAGALGSVAAATNGGRGAPLHDLRSGRRHRVPDASEGVHALTVGLARLRVLDEGVERVMVVRHLETSVGALRRPDERCHRAAGKGRLPARDQRWPGDRALSGARARAVAVLSEQIERTTLRIDEDLA